ncbi:MAG TPA: translation initiation factor IF-2 [Deltaproteobacteria bacterium]|nr:translation initiation factor IF-2 [Deltaproteobacteria bacterium]
MAKIKITTLSDRMKDDEILSKLKSIGVKIKDKEKEKEGQPQKEVAEKTTASGETVIEKRVASTVIRRRVQRPQPETEKEKTAVETKEMPSLEETPTEVRRVRREPVGEGKTAKTAEPVRHPEDGGVELVRIQEDVGGDKTIDVQPEIQEGAPEIQQKMEAQAAETTAAEQASPEIREAVEQVEEEPVKTDMEGMAQEKQQEITRALEEAYKQDLHKEFPLVEEGEEEERQKKKVERLLKKMEEEEQETTKGVKKKGVLKRKVVIKEEELYAFRRQKGKTLPFRHRAGRRDEARHEDDKRLEQKQSRKVRISDEIQVGELAKRLSVKSQDVISRLLSLGIMANINQSVDYDTAYLVANELGYEVEKIVSMEEEFQAMEAEQKEAEVDANMKPRPPVVTVMGHVDHGKTLLLDTIRNTNVAEREAGGITQHIGAYLANVNGKHIAFVDTPGHEAFTAMRARGALVTDIVILVVAADDGVMPQTIEAINHAKAAKVPIIVAINKIDKENANPDRVLRELSDHGLVPEEWGGSTLMAKISAKKKIGIEELMELIILQSEMLELKANPDKLAKGIIIESGLDKGHGPVGTVIIQEGTLNIHDPFVAGTTFGRVRTLVDDKGKRTQKAGPATPVLVVGFSEVPRAGDPFVVTTEERYARELSKHRQEKMREKEMAKSSRVTLDELYSRMGESEKLTLNVILKGDARGTVDAINDALTKLSTEAVEIQIIHAGVGAITETDVNLAMASGAVIIGFNAKTMPKTQALADQEHIEIRTYSVIYDMIDDMRKAMEGMLAPKIVEVKIGKAEVRKVFTVSKVGTIAGCGVTEGKVTRNAIVKVLRNDKIVFTGKLASLKRFKDDAKEVQAGYECGLNVEGFNDIRESDTLEFYAEQEEKQTLDG